jgi:hypothetical protein
MAGRRNLALPLCLTLALIALLEPGCTPRRIEASPQGFSASGLADFTIRVADSLTLAASGRLTAATPSDDSVVAPSATLAFALFTEGESGPVTRHAHILFSELPQVAWRWEKETWAKHEALLYSSMRSGGKNWTIQIFPVIAEGDWFSALWQQNNRQVPDFWLAKRWSSTPQDEMRLLAEYREPAPACIREGFAETPTFKGRPMLPKGRELRRGCEQEIEAFSARADAVFAMDKRQDLQAAPSGKALSLPQTVPDMARLVGRAEKNSPFPDGR